MRQYSHRLTVRCASPIFKPIAYKLSFTNRKRKYFEEKTTTTLKIKQTSIATVRNHILTVACFLTLLPFHYPLPFRMALLFYCFNAHANKISLRKVLVHFIVKIRACQDIFTPACTVKLHGTVRQTLK